MPCSPLTSKHSFTYLHACWGIYDRHEYTNPVDSLRAAPHTPSFTNPLYLHSAYPLPSQVFNRQLEILEEEFVQPKFLRAMRFMYQTQPGRLLLRIGVARLLKWMTNRWALPMADQQASGLT